jgi:hypothetical protein
MFNSIILTSRKICQSRSLINGIHRNFTVKVGEKVPSSLVAIVKYENGSFENEIIDTQEYF